MGDDSINGSRVRRAGRMTGAAAGVAAREATARVLSERSASRQRLKTARSLVRVLSSMRGAAMKVGQTLSAVDLGLVPDDVREEFQAVLAQLQHDAEPIPFRAVEKVVEEDLGRKLSTAFAAFDPSPVAAASINWYDKEERDPWWTGGPLPKVPERCGDPTPAPRTTERGPLTPDFGPMPPPQLTSEGCSVFNPGPSTCSYVAKVRGGVGGYAPDPEGWVVRITRPGLAEPIVIPSLGDREIYACGTIKPGDKVEVVAKPGANAFAGDPAICF